MAGPRAQGGGQGPAKGWGKGSARAAPLDTSPDAQGERSNVRWGGLKAAMRAYSAANPERRVTERAPSRVEIAEIARGDMIAGRERLVLLLHTARSETAAVQAWRELKELAYGRDPQLIAIDDSPEDARGFIDGPPVAGSMDEWTQRAKARTPAVSPDQPPENG